MAKESCVQHDGGHVARMRQVWLKQVKIDVLVVSLMCWWFYSGAADGVICLRWDDTASPILCLVETGATSFSQETFYK